MHRKPGTLVTSNTSGDSDFNDARRQVRRVSSTFLWESLFQSSTLLKVIRNHTYRKNGSRSHNVFDALWGFVSWQADGFV